MNRFWNQESVKRGTTSPAPGGGVMGGEMWGKVLLKPQKASARNGANNISKLKIVKKKTEVRAEKLEEHINGAKKLLFSFNNSIFNIMKII